MHSWNVCIYVTKCFAIVADTFYYTLVSWVDMNDVGLTTLSGAHPEDQRRSFTNLLLIQQWPDSSSIHIACCLVTVVITSVNTAWKWSRSASVKHLVTITTKMHTHTYTYTYMLQHKIGLENVRILREIQYRRKQQPIYAPNFPKKYHDEKAMHIIHTLVAWHAKHFYAGHRGLQGNCDLSFPQTRLLQSQVQAQCLWTENNTTKWCVDKAHSTLM